MQEQPNKKNILLNIVGEQSLPTGNVSRIEIETEGCYYETEGIKYIEYVERSDFPTPQQRNSHTQVAVGNEWVSLMRTGEGGSHIIFKKGMRSINAYATAAGPVEMNIFPLMVQAEVDEEGGSVELEYQLGISGHYAGVNALSITYRITGNRM